MRANIRQGLRKPALLNTSPLLIYGLWPNCESDGSRPPRAQRNIFIVFFVHLKSDIHNSPLHSGVSLPEYKIFNCAMKIRIAPMSIEVQKRSGN